MPTSNLIRFDRPLRGASITGRHRRVTTEELEAARTAAYQEGQDAARDFANQQMVELRSEVQELQNGIFARLENLQPELLAQVKQVLPELVIESTRRLLNGFEPNAEQVDAICQETLDKLYPETNNLELRLSPRDADLLEGMSPDWMNRYPGLQVARDSHLRAGDCVVHSRFGVTDARLDAKLQNLSHELHGRH
jgi:flagellar assembly protein FliH